MIVKSLAVVIGLMVTPAFALAQTYYRPPPRELHCPGDRVAWVNTRTGVYHFQGERYFGSTKNGTYMCQHEADAEGDRPTRNGQ
jgi:hypothetical protein